ncbi:MAG: hypothetical protein A2X34_06815 [Elusimicrobia bacterium GWC2_51_8]|nr:MAG: hypothetical protein A2X33_00965 [Elusimicrobia bacterium GWA2_51_34]OGR61294.1 MAG: hypothetical protein A2X34_06815 [Elusimicrobia bacterium GWC2_51_8]OGR88555.1 MAG: hypothetical protein A2021_08540 [Elusimicrobia bacterium GWF2_52_66]HAF95482.1 hypothetical protein [Elusimicrobiota bacterium]HCE97222.1 hypothetical protein [Elusimicrobiota bacterium]
MATITFCPPLIYNQIRLYNSLGVISLAAVARNCGHQVNIRDINIICTDTEQLGKIENFAGYLLSDRPDIIGFSTVYNSYPATIRMAIACKRLRPDVYVLMGGPMASATAEETLRAYNEIDGIMVGECEVALESFIKEFEHGRNWSNVPNLVWRNCSQLTRNQQAPLVENLDSLPLPAYDLSPFSLADAGTILIEAGRGCPHRCSYCSTSRFWNSRIRMKSAHKLLEQTKMLLAKYRTNNVKFVSDNFTGSPDFCLEFCKAVKADGVKFKWYTSACVDALNSNLTEKMAEAGCKSLFVGIETGTAKVHKIIGKRMLDQAFVIKNIINANKAGIGCTASFIVGFPGEDLSDVRETLKLLLDVMFAGNRRNIIQLHTLTPHSGTPIAQNNIHQLEFDGFSPGPECHLSKKDGTMIRSHPDIFTSFYTIKNDELSKAFLLRLCLIIIHMQNFPDTMLLLWRQERMRFLDLLLSQAKHLKKDDTNWFIQNRTETIALVYRFFRQRILPQLDNSKKMQETLLHEYMINKTAVRLEFESILRFQKPV